MLRNRLFLDLVLHGVLVLYGGRCVSPQNIHRLGSWGLETSETNMELTVKMLLSFVVDIRDDYNGNLTCKLLEISSYNTGIYS